MLLRHQKHACLSRAEISKGLCNSPERPQLTLCDFEVLEVAQLCPGVLRKGPGDVIHADNIKVACSLEGDGGGGGVGYDGDALNSKPMAVANDDHNKLSSAQLSQV